MTIGTNGTETGSLAGRTVGELATEAPRWTEIFERYGIDYCCGGGRTLNQACETKGLTVENVIEAFSAKPEISGVVDSVDWAKQPLKRLVEHIERIHHAKLREELPRLLALGSKVARVHGPRKPELVKVSQVLSDFAQRLEAHMTSEEENLFPMCRVVEEGATEGEIPSQRSLEKVMAVLGQDHDEAGAAVASLRELTEGFVPPSDACMSYRSLFKGLAELECDMHIHVHLENNILFPRTLYAAKSLNGAGGCCGLH